MDRDALVEAILDLEHDRDKPIPDMEVAEELGAYVKRAVDQLVAIKAGQDVLSSTPTEEFDTAIDGVDAPAESEVTEAVAGTQGKPHRKRRKRQKVQEGHDPEPWRKQPTTWRAPIRLADLPAADQAHWIFMERYIPLEKHEEILGLSYEPEVLAEYELGFDRFVKDLLLLPKALGALESNDIPALQKLFASYVPIFRSPELADGDDNSMACSIETLRARFPSYFYKRRKKPNWFERHAFYTEAIAGPRWVLSETDYLNCTLRSPEKKLARYARDRNLTAECVQTKTVVEDIYDRIILREALEEDLLAGSCNCITGTRYGGGSRKAAQRLVYIVQKVHKVTIHGKAGIPHWKAKRRLWPGIHPTLSFAEIT
ncbi:MAG: hypothetical protein VX733_10880 [Candidatus Latescibacterota bacterium]|nr:hypothetical protein [Candidatus Latescibacterota bacterium]